MCTSIALRNGGFYFGRNMDIDFSFNEKIVITPRNYRFGFRRTGGIDRHYSMIGMASVSENYPLYAEAVNECGLAMAGLNFPGNAVYSETFREGVANISSFELIPWVLGQCDSVVQAKRLLMQTHIVGVPFSDDIPLAPLHWHIADGSASAVLEVMSDGIHVYDNPADVLTNNPPFEFHLYNLAQYVNLSVKVPESCLDGVALSFGKGLGSFGLPGDFSPASRFVKAAYLLKNSVCGKSEYENICQLFHLLDSVAVTCGSMPSEEYRTVYSCCMSDRGVYYLKGYYSAETTAVDMFSEELDGDELIIFEFPENRQVNFINRQRKTPADY